MDPGTCNPAPPAPPGRRPRTLAEILEEFEAPNQVQFDPFQPGACTKARANLPHSFPSQPQPIDYFNLFFTDSL